MKNIITTFILSLVAVGAIKAQVGVGTTSPQEALHIAGTGSTVRIDGLNSSQNTNNLGGSSTYNVVADKDGTLTLGKLSGEISSESNIPSPVVVQTQSNSALNSAELYQKNFTLTQRAMVVITYYVALDFSTYDGTAKIDDGRAKVAHNYFYLGNGSTANTSKSYGMTSVVYTNINCDTATGLVYNSRSTTIALDAGNYSVHLQGAVFGGGLTDDAAFRVEFGNGDRLDIQAIYL
ncbi:hypothetical protein [Marinirhabdus gelatinilytica]|uniref:Uncharacterized protein n=1 Tax=Marinirhabdus gelatinilytica TaxID=1703343 RepID=A0A370Q960_9FLAO|nr:hypothetical protein [Marinirhabdus gelatinilytica]RDK84883.1 hypothetical protein C8D94_104263 [Marinirhabdus gelatinilytica]